MRSLPPALLLLLLLAAPAVAQTPAAEIETASRFATVLVETAVSEGPIDVDDDTCSNEVIVPGVIDGCELGVDSALPDVGSSTAVTGYEVEVQQSEATASASATGEAHSAVSLDGELSSGAANANSRFDTSLVLHQPGTWTIDLALEANLLELDDPLGFASTTVQAFYSVRKNGELLASETISDSDPSPTVFASTGFSRDAEPAAAGDSFEVSVSVSSLLLGYEQASIDGSSSYTLALFAPEPEGAPMGVLALAVVFGLARVSKRRAAQGAASAAIL